MIWTLDIYENQSFNQIINNEFNNIYIRVFFQTYKKLIYILNIMDMMRRSITIIEVRIYFVVIVKNSSYYYNIECIWKDVTKVLFSIQMCAN